MISVKCFDRVLPHGYKLAHNCIKSPAKELLKPSALMSFDLKQWL